MKPAFLIVLTGLALALPPGPSARSGEPIILGWIERVQIYPGNIQVIAKLDTGAKTSSINAYSVREYQRDGQLWVRFRLTNRKGRTMSVERPVVRQARIRRAGGKTQTRDVIMLGICLGSVYREVEVNLSDRRALNYQMLIGRTFMAEKILVDSGRTYVQRPKCAVRVQ